MKYAVAIVLSILLFAVWHHTRRARPPADPSPQPAPAQAPMPGPTRQEPNPAAYDPAFDALNDSARPIEEDLRDLAAVFMRYRIFVKDPSGNPRGTHREIVQALQGRNRARLAFLPATHPALNAQGELCDRWGTPYFFHSLSSERLEIRSAGPDRTFWTDDDAVFDPAAERGRESPLSRADAKSIRR